MPGFTTGEGGRRVRWSNKWLVTQLIVPSKNSLNPDRAIGRENLRLSLLRLYGTTGSADIHAGPVPSGAAPIPDLASIEALHSSKFHGRM